MSTKPDLDLDLELSFLPAWAHQAPAQNPYAQYDGAEAPSSSAGRRQGRPALRKRSPGGRGRGPGSSYRDAARHRGGRRRPESRTEVQPLPELGVVLIPDPHGVENLARQIKLTGRAYPIFNIAQFILKRPDRFQVRIEVVKKADGAVPQPLWLCALDQTLWLSEEEGIQHVLKTHFDAFYQTEKTPTDPPKGKFTFVARCGLSGEILGPPNYHSYQTKLHKLHNERFAHLPFEVYKSKIKIVRDEEVVQKWLEDQSWKTEYTCLNVPEPRRLANWAEVQAHFREIHASGVLHSIDAATLNQEELSRTSSRLQRLVRSTLEDQRRFPLKVVNVLSQQFARLGLQFFKVNKSITHVAVSRPHYLDLEATPVSEGVRRIVEYVDTHPKCTRREVIDSLAPVEAHPAEPPATPEVASTNGDSPQTESPKEENAPATTEPAPTPEQQAVIADLHWLIHQGHVIEFADARLETAKKPAVRPQRPAPKAEQAAQTDLETEEAKAQAADASVNDAPATPEVSSEGNPDHRPSEESPQTQESVNGASSSLDSSDSQGSKAESEGGGFPVPPSSDSSIPAANGQEAAGPEEAPAEEEGASANRTEAKPDSVHSLAVPDGTP